MRKKLIKWLSLVCILLCSCGFMLLGVACGDQSAYELYGFAPAAEIGVRQGDFVQTETLYVFDSEDNYYDVKYKVLNGSGAQVETSGKGFFALDATDYKIVYTVIAARGTYVRETRVRVTAGGGTGLNVYVPETGAVNEPVEIVIESAALQKYTFTVTATCGGETAEVKNYAFTPAQSGRYTVKVTAVSDEETISRLYFVNVKEEMTEGTVELYDESWSNKRGDWGVVTSEEAGLKDRFGGESRFLTVESDTEYLYAYVSPKMDKKYYEKLAEDGYEYVSVWIYLDCRFAHTVQQSSGKGPFYRTAHRVLPKTWYEIRYNLKDDPKYDFQGSFLKGFDYFASLSQCLFLVDNSDEYNGPNGGRERDEQGNVVPFKVYVDDIYAVKQGESIKVNEAAKPSLKTGDSFDLKNLIDSEIKNDLLYTVTHRGRTIVAEGGNYTFASNGSYEITASYGAGTPNRYGAATFTLEVAPRYTARADSLIREKTGEFAEIDLHHLNVSLKDETGAPVSDADFRYKATKNGKAVPVDGSVMRADSVGGYRVEVEIGYRYGGVDCTLYLPAEVDVWDESSKYTVFDFDGNSAYFADSYFMNKPGWDIVPAPTVVREAHGKQGNIARVEITNQQQPIFGVRPMYSLNYYRQLLEEAEREDAGELVFSFDYFVEDTQNSATSGSRRIGVFPDSGRTQSVRCGEWNTVSFPLEDFVNDYYEKMTSDFDYLDGLRGGANITIDSAPGYAFFYLMNFGMNATDLYFGSGAVLVKAPLNAEEWLEMVNGEKRVADYTQGGYADTYYDTGLTYFQRNHHVWPRAQSGIVTETVGGVEGTYAKVVAAVDGYDKTVSVYLPNTVSMDLLKQFAASGFVLKINVFIDAPAQTRNAYALEYDESASAFKTITDSSRTFRIATGEWQEIEIDLNDYIRLCERLGDHYGEQINNDTQGVLGIQVKGPWAMYFGAPYLALPAADEEIVAKKGETADFAQMLPDDGAEYEIYLSEGGTVSAFEGTSVTVGAENIDVVVVSVIDHVRTVVKVIGVRPPASLPADPGTVTDFTQGSYADPFYETGLTYFQRNHHVWPRAQSGIVTETVGGVEGTYAKIVATSDIDYDQTVSVYLPNTLRTETLKLYADAGYRLKVKLFVDAPEQERNAYSLEYDESASAFKAITDSSRSVRITTGVWQEIEIDLNDYIRLCDQLGDHYGEQINNATQGVLGIQVQGPWAMYFSELYLVAPADQNGEREKI